MTDILTPEKRSWVMSRIRGTNTKIDLKMKSMLVLVKNGDQDHQNLTAWL